MCMLNAMVKLNTGQEIKSVYRKVLKYVCNLCIENGKPIRFCMSGEDPEKGVLEKSGLKLSCKTLCIRANMGNLVFLL